MSNGLVIESCLNVDDDGDYIFIEESLGNEVPLDLMWLSVSQDVLLG